MNLNHYPPSNDQFDFVFDNDVEVANLILQDNDFKGARNLLVEDTLQEDIAELIESLYEYLESEYPEYELEYEIIIIITPVESDEEEVIGPIGGHIGGSSPSVITVPNENCENVEVCAMTYVPRTGYENVCKNEVHCS